MSVRSRYRSRLKNATELSAILIKMAALYAQKSSRIVFEIGNYRVNASLCDSVVIDYSLTHNNIQFGRPPLTGGKERTTVATIADTGARAVGTLDLTADIVLTKALMGTAENTRTFTLQVLAAAANPSATVIAAFTGTAAAIVLTITPNDGTNNTATPVNLSTAQIAELINTGAVAGKTITLTDASSLRVKQTATGGGATAVADAGEGDGVVATFSGGAASNLNSKYFTMHDASDATKFYVWLNVNSEGVDPAVAASTGIPVAVAAGASANTIASAIQVAVDAKTEFVATVSTNTVTITNAAAGYSTDIADGAAATGFTIARAAEIESYDSSDITLIKRLRTKKWLIQINGTADHEFDAS